LYFTVNDWVYIIAITTSFNKKKKAITMLMGYHVAKISYESLEVGYKGY
jgi:hypothetical protein